MMNGADDIDRTRLAAFGLLAIVSTQCMGPQRRPVMYGMRDTPKNLSDSGWILSSGHESVEFSSDPDNYKLVPLEMMIQTDQTLAALRDFPVGTEITRRQIGEPWRFIVDGKVVDADGKVVGALK
jgi:hypothetical protein